MKNYSAEILPERVAEAMRRTGTTQQQLAEALGLAQQHISLRLRGEVRFTVADLVALSAYFKCTPGELLAADVLFTGGL
jgi:transcriptional regulator with XRE-family HTH domain